MAWVPYDSYLEGMMDGSYTAFVDHDADTFKISLHTVTYSPNRATHQYHSDLTNEVSGTNYTAGGNACASPTVTVAANVVTWDANDPATWSQSGAGFNDARIAVLYKDSGVSGTSNLVAYNDFGSSKGNVDGDLTVQLDTDGIATLGSA